MRNKNLLSLRLLLAISSVVLALPACAQTQGGEGTIIPSPGFLSDVSGLSLDNLGVSSRVAIQVGVAPELRNVSVNAPLPAMVVQADSPAGIALLDNVIEFNRNMDKLLPFCGCSNVNWRAYNHTVQVSVQLRGTLAASVAEQQKILASNPTPQQLGAVQKRLQAIESTTTALEKAVSLLSRLGKALEKAR